MVDQDFESQEELGLGGKVKNWIQDNIRIIISVLIVVVIAGGIYSYSNRSQEMVYDDELDLEDEFIIDEDLEEGDDSQVDDSEEKDAEEEVQIDGGSAGIDEKTVSQETEGAFVETAVTGDGATHLARKALASYLEKNNDSELTAEHKIYIEDYLRKNVNYGGTVGVGEQISFSKDLIKDSIEKAKTLTEDQLRNLEKYSALVSDLK